MLEFIMDRNVLLYVLAAACAVGVVSQLILKQVYAGLIRDTRNTGEVSGRFLVQLRQRFQYCTHLNEKVGDVQALIRRNLIEYRFWGMNLHQWQRIGQICLAVSVLCAFAGTMSLWQDGSRYDGGRRYVFRLFPCIDPRRKDTGTGAEDGDSGFRHCSVKKGSGAIDTDGRGSCTEV